MNEPPAQLRASTLQILQSDAFQKFWTLWMLATTWPWGVLGVVAMIPISINVSWGHPAIITLIWGLLCGAVGISQQRLLQHYGELLRWWPLATVIGGVLAMGSCLSLFLLFALFPIIVGTTVSIAQWLVLRDRFPARTALWIPLNLGIGILGNLLLLLFYRMMFFSPPGSQLDSSMFLKLTIVVGGIAIAVTGSFFTALVLYRWMMRSNTGEADNNRA